MKILATFVALAFFGNIAHAKQIFRCTDKAQGVTATVTLTNETSPIEQVKATSKVVGFWRESSRLGTGGESSINSSDLNPIYEYQVEGKKAVTVWTEDKYQNSITYHFTFSKELLGAAFDSRKVNGWIDPDYPEGGGHPLDLICSSTGSR